MTKDPKFNAEKVPSYTITLTACAYENCTSKDLLIEITDNNEAPIWTPNFFLIEVYERDAVRKFHNCGTLYSISLKNSVKIEISMNNVQVGFEQQSRQRYYRFSENICK